MTEKIAFEVRPKKGKQIAKSVFLKAFFYHLAPSKGNKNKSKISYLGEIIIIQMTNVKNVGE